MDNRLRILVVEDEPNMRELVQARLEHAGYTVEVAPDGFQGLTKSRTFHPDLVILDLMLPKLDGYTICRMIKSRIAEPVPVILFTARTGPDDARRGLDMGADAYVNKPFEQSELMSKIEKLLKPKLDALRAVQARQEAAAGKAEETAAPPAPGPETPPAQPVAPQAGPAATPAPEQAQPPAQDAAAVQPATEPEKPTPEAQAPDQVPEKEAQAPEQEAQAQVQAQAPEQEAQAQAQTPEQPAPVVPAPAEKPSPPAPELSPTQAEQPEELAPSEPAEAKPAGPSAEPTPEPVEGVRPGPPTDADLAARVGPPKPEESKKSDEERGESEPEPKRAGFFKRLFGRGRQEEEG